MVLVGAAYGTLWETGALNRVWSWLVVGNVDARGLFREMVAAILGRGPLPVGRLFLAVRRRCGVPDTRAPDLDAVGILTALRLPADSTR